MKIKQMLGTLLITGALAGFIVPALATGTGNTTGWASASTSSQHILAHHGKSGKGKQSGKTKGKCKSKCKGNSSKHS